MMSQEFAQLDQSQYGSDSEVPTEVSSVGDGRREISRPVAPADEISPSPPTVGGGGGGGGGPEPTVGPVSEEMDRETRRGGGKSARHWMFTIHVDSLDEAVLAVRRAWVPQPHEAIRYVVAQKERCPTTGRLHWQGYVQMKSAVRHNAVRNALGAPWAWIEPARGTAEQCRAYCTKTESREVDTVPVEIGEINGRQGKRNDLDVPAEMIKQGKRMIEVAELDPVAYIRNHRGFGALDALYKRARACQTFRELRVVVIWGPPGTGKTRWVYDSFPRDEIYALTVGAAEQTWWDGYDGHKVLLIDDFTGQLKWNFILRVLDGHPLQMPVKGSMTYAEFTTVCITCNMHWSEWYRRDETGRRQMRALQRRITEVRYLPAPGADAQVELRSPGYNPVDGTGLVSIPDPPAMAEGFHPGM